MILRVLLHFGIRVLVMEVQILYGVCINASAVVTVGRVMCCCLKKTVCPDLMALVSGIHMVWLL